jgi:hypothetical protein
MKLLLASAILLFAGAAHAGPPEPNGWQNLRWGMTVEDVKAVLGDQVKPMIFPPNTTLEALEALDPALARTMWAPKSEEDPKNSKLYLPDYEIDSERYVVVLMFAPSPGGLYGVTLLTFNEHTTRGHADRMLQALEQKYGQPTHQTEIPEKPDCHQVPNLNTCYKKTEDEWGSRRRRFSIMRQNFIGTERFLLR